MRQHGCAFFNKFVFQWRPQAMAFDLVTSKSFERIIWLFVGLNMLAFVLDGYERTKITIYLLDYSDLLFVCVFSAECVLKTFALGCRYFEKPWNLFDFFVAVLSISSELFILYIESIQ